MVKAKVVIDAPNVAIRHGKQKAFSSRGVEIALDYWQRQGHDAVGFLPQYYLDFDRVGSTKRAAELGLKDQRYVPDDVPLLKRLADENRLILTPPQDYDDSYCIQYAQAREI